MAYQIKRPERIVEDLELMAVSDHPAMIIHIDINPEAMARDYRRLELTLAKAKQAGDMASFEKAAGDLFTLICGEEAVERILAYFKGSYVDMTAALLPFVFDCIKPAVERYVQSRREILANNTCLNRRQRRKIGL
ncbi:MAG: hypothetical protein IJN57_05315 [Oscillospiraceae bacterium]|nr:hypothetical protein [Oscillospiraceae bacterium]